MTLQEQYDAAMLDFSRGEFAAAQSGSPGATPGSDLKLQTARPEPPPAKVIRRPDKFPEQPWKKKS
jgi:hypothetical protein